MTKVGLRRRLRKEERMVDPADPEVFNLDLTQGQTYCELDRETDKPLLVCIHGWSTASYVWKGLRPCLRKKGYRVLTYDLYGRGRSARPDAEHTTALFTDPRFRSEVHHRQALFEMRAQARMKKGPGGENFDRRSLR